LYDKFTKKIVEILMPNAHTNKTHHTDCFNYAGTDLKTKKMKNYIIIELKYVKISSKSPKEKITALHLYNII